MSSHDTTGGRHSTRLPGFDYAHAGAYFVTICAHGRQSLFGSVVAGEVALNGNGRLVAEEWLRSAEVRHEVELDAFVVMPNHVHGIILIAGLEEPAWQAGARRAPLRRTPRSLGAFVAGFKAAVTRRINLARGTPDRQV